MTTKEFVMAIDQGTTSTRAIIFNHSGEIVSVGQKEFTQIFPNPGWVEHNPIEIWDTTRQVVADALQKAEINRHQLAAVGITNQRETTVVWDKNTGEPVYNAIVWQDMRTSDIVKELEGDEGPDRFRQICGLGLSPYFSGSKIKWILAYHAHGYPHPSVARRCLRDFRHSHVDAARDQVLLRDLRLRP